MASIPPELMFNDDTPLQFGQDIDGKIVSNNDILFDGEHYHRLCLSTHDGDYLLSCTKGYTHDPTIEMISGMTRMGTFETHKHLLECD